jgi:putative flippase GtrA
VRPTAASGAPAQLSREFAFFSVVGAGGFAIDASLFLLINSALGWPILAARAISASVSICTTWALNRRITFAHRRSRRRGAELVRYAIVQGAGLVVNFGVFASLIAVSPTLRAVPIAALALGAAAALIFNFLSARSLAFGWRQLP